MKEFIKVSMVVLLAAIAVAWGCDLFSVKTALLTCVNIPAGSDMVFLAMAAVVAPFPVDPELTAIAVAYKNEKYIADLVLPRVPVGKQNFKYRVFSKAESFTIPNTAVGRTSAPTRVEFGFTESDSSAIDRALEDPVPEADIENAPVGYDPLARATSSIMDLIQLDREKRAADLLFGASNYGSSNKATLSGATQWSHADSKPFDAIEDALDVCVMRPNIVVMGQAVWAKFKRHANVIARVLGSANSKGVVARQAVADALEVDQVIVGQGWHNSAAKGQTATLERLWGKFCALIYQDKLADTRGRITFGYTAQFGSPESGKIVDPHMGLRGGTIVKAGESVKELITANDLGYLFSTAVA